MFGLSTVQLAIAGALLAVALTAGGIACVYQRGEEAGSGAITTAVQSETIKTLDAAQKSKEKADEAVRRTPLDDLVDGLR